MSSFVICLALGCASTPFAVQFSLLGRRGMPGSLPEGYGETRAAVHPALRPGSDRHSGLRTLLHHPKNKRSSDIQTQVGSCLTKCRPCSCVSSIKIPYYLQFGVMLGNRCPSVKLLSLKLCPQVITLVVGHWATVGIAFLTLAVGLAATVPA